MSSDLNKEPRTTDGPAKPAGPTVTESLPVLDAAQILGGSAEVWLEFRGARYRLRVTRRGRLILQK